MPPTATNATNGHAPEPTPKPAAPSARNPFDALWDATRNARVYEEVIRDNLEVRNLAGIAVAELMMAAATTLVVDGERVFRLVHPVGGGQPFVRVERGVYLHTLDGLVRTQVSRKARPTAHHDGAHACCDPRLPEPDDEALAEAAWHAAAQDVARIHRNAATALDRCVMGDGAPRPPSDDVEPAGDADELRGFGARLTRAAATAR